MNASIRTFLVPAVSAVALMLVSCAGGGAAAWDAEVGKRNMALQPASSLAGVTVPVLRAPGLDSKWGAPQMDVAADGSYRLSYKDPSRPFERLVIYGSPKPMPQLTEPPLVSYEDFVNDELVGLTRPQSWQSTVILSRSVRWFKESDGSGADGEYWGTEGFSATAADGRSGNYRLVIETITKSAPARFGEVGW